MDIILKIIEKANKMIGFEKCLSSRRAKIGHFSTATTGGDNMRPNWDDYFMEMAEVVKNRSTCLRRKVGAVIVKDRRILATGYNGAPAKTPHCLDIGCYREKLKIPSGERAELCRGTHAEQNAIIQAAYHGVSVKDSILYVTLQPCVLCAKMAINAGIKSIYFKGQYPDELSLKILQEAGVKLVKFD